MRLPHIPTSAIFLQFIVHLDATVPLLLVDLRVLVKVDHCRPSVIPPDSMSDVGCVCATPNHSSQPVPSRCLQPSQPGLFTLSYPMENSSGSVDVDECSLERNELLVELGDGAVLLRLFRFRRDGHGGASRRGLSALASHVALDVFDEAGEDGDDARQSTGRHPTPETDRQILLHHVHRSRMASEEEALEVAQLEVEDFCSLRADGRLKVRS